VINKVQAYIQGLLSKMPSTGPVGIPVPNLQGPSYIRHATRTRKSQPGLKRKGIKFIPPVPINAHKLIRKPCDHSGAHRFDPIRGATPAPTIDFVRKLEIALERRLNVKQGQIYYKDTGEFINIPAVQAMLREKRHALAEATYQARILATDPPA